jgi:hypothetical protein
LSSAGNPAERYVRVLDYMSRCALAIDRGDWHYLWDKAVDLAQAADTLASLAQTAATRNARHHPQAPRGPVVRAVVVRQGRLYHAGRLLHPAPQTTNGGGR